MPRFDTSDISRYYDRHTEAFIRYGQGGRVGAIHRALRGSGTGSRSDAFHYVEDLIVEATRPLLSTSATPHLVDLGCGVCGSLCYIAGRLPIRGTGLTISPVQARMADQRIREAGLEDRVRCVEADFCDIPGSVPPADLAFAIESFVHGAAPDRFFAECGRLVRAGGLLVICDDFKRSAPTATATRAIDRYCRGWHVNTLVTLQHLHALADAGGFDVLSTVDLSSAIEVRRARDRAISAMAAIVAWWPWTPRRLDYLLGGSALQQCLAHGWIAYDLTVFRRRGSPA